MRDGKEGRLPLTPGPSLARRGYAYRKLGRWADAVADYTAALSHQDVPADRIKTLNNR